MGLRVGAVGIRLALAAQAAGTVPAQAAPVVTVERSTSLTKVTLTARTTVDIAYTHQNLTPPRTFDAVATTFGAAFVPVRAGFSPANGAVAPGALD